MLRELNELLKIETPKVGEVVKEATLRTWLTMFVLSESS